MHTTEMHNSDGLFSEWAKEGGRKCPQCGSEDILYRSWESNCGGYQDYQYKCQGCDKQWWVDGPDA